MHLTRNKDVPMESKMEEEGDWAQRRRVVGLGISDDQQELD
jgi:hypothetical protein